MERMQGERAMIANIQGLNANAGRDMNKPLISANWLEGTWTKPGDNCCDPMMGFTLTVTSEDTFDFQGTAGAGARLGFTRGIFRDGDSNIFTPGARAQITRLTVLNENSMNVVLQNGMTFVVSKDTKTDFKTTQGYTRYGPLVAAAPQPQVMHGPLVAAAPQPQVIYQQPVGRGARGGRRR